MSSHAGDAAGASTAGVTSDSESMKRAAVKNLIERYFRQLTEGCGNAACDNAHCFSSGRVEAMTRDQAAAAALQLFKSKGNLCPVDAASPDHHAFKIPRSSPPAMTASLSGTAPAASTDAVVEGAVSVATSTASTSSA